MNTEKLERANILAKSLIPKVNELLNMSPKSMRSSLADAIFDEKTKVIEGRQKELEKAIVNLQDALKELEDE